MLIVYDNLNNKIINNFGTNSLYPDGNIPIEEKENVLYIKINDNSKFAKDIINAYDYELILDENDHLVDVVARKSFEQYKLEQQLNPTFSEEQVDEEKVSMAEAIVNLTMELELLKIQVGGTI